MLFCLPKDSDTWCSLYSATFIQNMYSYAYNKLQTEDIAKSGIYHNMSETISSGI